VAGTERAWYVGQTRRSFGRRTAEHVADYLSGKYPVNDVDDLLQGKHNMAAGTPDGWWPENLPAFLANHERLMPKIVQLIRRIHIHVAPLVGDAHLHDRVEGAIGRCYKLHSDPALKSFFMPGIKVPTAIPGDKPLRLLLSSETPIAGLPSELRE